MVLKLYGHGFSTCTRRVVTTLHEKQIPFEFIAVDVAKAEHKTPDYLKKQPFGQIPYIDDDGFILYESRAIARYVCEKYASQGPALIPTDLKAKAIFEQAASVETSNFDVYASKAVAETVFKPMRGVKPDQAVFDELISQLEKRLEVYDTILGTQKYVAGNDFTVVDIFHLPYATMLSRAGSDVMTKFPNVSRWFKDISSRKSWVAHQDGITSMETYSTGPASAN